MTNLILEETGCPLCREPRSNPVVTAEDYLYRIPGQFTFTKCSACRHVFLNPRPSRETIGQCYPQTYVPHLSTKTENTSDDMQKTSWLTSGFFKSIPGLRALYRWLMDDRSDVILPCPKDNPRALEIGCATGDYLFELKNAGWNVTGVEPAEQAAAFATARGLDVRQGTLDDVRVEPESFDAIFAWMVIEHLHDPLATIDHICELLKPQGTFCFSVPNYGCWEPSVFGRYWLGYDAPRHLHQFTPRSLRRMLQECGFEQIQIIHQYNARYIYGSFGAWLCDRNPGSRLGTALLRYFVTNPPLWLHLGFAPLAKLLAWIRQSGRLTVTAKRRIKITSE